MTIGRVLLLTTLFTLQPLLCRASLTFPSWTDALPCANTYEACAAQYYLWQKDQMNMLNIVYNLAADVQDAAGSLLTTVQNLLADSTGLIARIDPDNSRTNGGEIRQISNTQSILVGVTPYMATLSQRLVSSANQRETDLANLVSTLSSGMSQINNILTNAKTSANSQFTSMSSSFQTAISAQSASLRDFFIQMDAKLEQASTLFDTSSNSAPSATANSLVQALQLEASDFANARTKLLDIYNQISAIPTTLGVYLNKSIDSLTAYQQQQEAGGSSQSASASWQFSSQLNSTANALTAKLNGILATAVSDTYYNSSLTAYMSTAEAALIASMKASNQTEQSNINAMLSNLKTISKTVSTAFQPILNDMTTWVARIVAQDNAFQNAAQATFNDANATVTATNSSFTSFASNMKNLWNTTGSILSGQTTTISESLLAQIGNMTAQAGAEVNNLNALMLEAGNGALQADSVRQAILNGSAQQVLTFIGSNAAAVNQSIATIKNFLSNSQSEISLIMSVLQLMSGSRLSQLNQTANSAIGGIQKQISVFRNGTNSTLVNLKNTVNQYLQTSQSATNLVYTALQQAGNSSLSQANSLIAAMSSANTQTLGQTQTQVNAASALVSSAVSVSNQLASTVNGIPGQAQAEQKSQLATLDSIVANATANLTSAQNSINAQFLAVKQSIEQAATQLETNESNAVQAMASVLNSASALFDQQTTALTTQFQQLLSALKANVTITESKISEINSQLRSAEQIADNQYTASLSNLQKGASTALSTLKSGINSYVNGMQKTVSAEATSEVKSASGTVTSAINALKSQMTKIEGNVSALSASVSQLQNTPQALVNKAAQLQKKFSTELTALRDSISSLASQNDKKSSEFAKEVNATFGKSVLGVDGLITGLESQIKAAESAANRSILNGAASLNKTISTARSGMNVSADSYLSKIDQQRAATASLINNVIQTAFNSMNASVDSFSKNVTSLNETIYNTLNSSAILQARLARLQADINGTASQVGNSTQAASIADLVAVYGSSIAQQVQNLMNSSQTQLTSAQKSAVLQQLLTANTALGAAGGINATGSALANAVEAAISQVLAASTSMQANTGAVRAKLDAVSITAGNTVSISANQIAAIISKYSQDTATTKEGIEAQFKAAGVASVSVKDAMRVWDSLKKSALKLTTDELDDLGSTQDEVFKHTDGLISKTETEAKNDVKNLSGKMKGITENLTRAHKSNMAIIDSLVSRLNQLATSAGNEKAGFEQQVANLRGSVNGLINQLNSRYTSITAQGAQFKSLIESAAAKDIAGLTKTR